MSARRNRKQRTQSATARSARSSGYVFSRIVTMANRTRISWASALRLCEWMRQQSRDHWKFPELIKGYGHGAEYETPRGENGRFTRPDGLAEVIGCTRRQAIRVVHLLEQKGLVVVEGEMVRVKDWQQRVGGRGNANVYRPGPELERARQPVPPAPPPDEVDVAAMSQEQYLRWTNERLGASRASPSP